MSDDSKTYDNSHGEDNSHASSAAELARFGTRMTDVVGTTPVRAFARAADVDQKSLRAYMDGVSEPSRAALVRLARAGKVTVEWLATGEGAKTRVEAAQRQLDSGTATYQAAPDDQVEIPLYNVQAAAGAGLRIEDEKIVGTRTFSRSWIEARLRMRPEDLALCTVRGDSMEDKLSDGDLLMINTKETRVRREDIYVLRQGDDLMVKRLQRIPAIGGFRMISENKEYDSIDVYPAQAEENQMQIVGRVVWWAHTNNT